MGRPWPQIGSAKGDSGRARRAVLSRDGEVLTLSEHVVGRWEEHFKEHLNLTDSGPVSLRKTQGQRIWVGCHPCPCCHLGSWDILQR